MRTIAGARTALHSPYGVTVGAGGLLYAVNALADGSSSVTVYAARSTGNTSPLHAIAGPNKGMDSASGVAVDQGGTAFVSDHGDRSKLGKVLAFAAGATFPLAPVRTLSGKSLAAPFGIGLATSGAILVVNHRQ